MNPAVTQFQILSPEPERSASFYAELFGWGVDADNPLGYRRFVTGGERGIQGGVWPAPPEARAFVQLFVEVGDVPAHVARAERLGARVIVPPQVLPEGETLAILHDPQGLSFGVVAPARRG